MVFLKRFHTFLQHRIKFFTHARRTGSHSLLFTSSGRQGNTAHAIHHQFTQQFASCQSGVSQGKEETIAHLHWWSFLAWFDAIGEGSFATVVAIRDKLRRGKRLENWELDYYRTHRAVVELRGVESAEEQAMSHPIKFLYIYKNIPHLFLLFLIIIPYICLSGNRQSFTTIKRE
jgi:hypothetical protein